MLVVCFEMGSLFGERKGPTIAIAIGNEGMVLNWYAGDQTSATAHSGEHLL
jgi:hypothetical protein